MFRRFLHGLGAVVLRVLDALRIILSGMDGRRNADESAAKLYQQPHDDYRP